MKDQDEARVARKRRSLFGSTHHVGASSHPAQTRAAGLVTLAFQALLLLPRSFQPRPKTNNNIVSSTFTSASPPQHTKLSHITAECQRVKTIWPTYTTRPRIYVLVHRRNRLIVAPAWARTHQSQSLLAWPCRQRRQQQLISWRPGPESKER